jgi:uncharacterized membrane protein YjgN (DUF898 family)
LSEGAPPRHEAFRFTGSWREFAPIAFSNLLLIIVTLGIYRFWAKSRERRYLWSRTDFIGDPLEWTGTGKELLVGFLMAVLIFAVPLILIQLLIEALITRSLLGWAQLSALLFSLSLVFLVGIGRFRALRYRLTRTRWHGIRGGGDATGILYGWSYLWKPVAGGLAFGLLVPWSMIALWNQRWSCMSFGSHCFEPAAAQGPLFRRLLLCYAGFLAAMILIALLSTMVPSSNVAAGVSVLIALILFVAALWTAFHAMFLRVAIDGLSLHRLRFHFRARTSDLIKLFAGDVALVVLTLGVGFVFLGYRHWAFLIHFLDASGKVDMAGLLQSRTAEPTQGEGLLDAFDMGAI